MSSFKVTEDIIRKVLIESRGIIKEDGTLLTYYQDEITQLRIIKYELLGSEILVKCVYEIDEEKDVDYIANIRINLLDYISFIYNDLKKNKEDKMSRIGTYHNGHDRKIIDKLNEVLGDVREDTIVQELFVNYFCDEDIEGIIEFFEDRLKEEEV